MQPRTLIRANAPQNDRNFNWVLKLDRRMERWRSLAAEWADDAVKNKLRPWDRIRPAIAVFLQHYILKYQLFKPEEVLARDPASPPLPPLIKGKARLRSKGLLPVTDWGIMCNNSVVAFCDWVIQNDSAIMEARLASNPFQLYSRRSFKPTTAQSHVALRTRGATSDVSFQWILKCNKQMEQWRALATEWLGFCMTPEASRPWERIQFALCVFVQHYLLKHELYRPHDIFVRNGEGSASLPPLIKSGPSISSPGTLPLTSNGVELYNHIVEFCDWVMHSKSIREACETRKTSNPFVPYGQQTLKPTTVGSRLRIAGATEDAEFRWILKLNPGMERWRSLAASWLVSWLAQDSSRTPTVARRALALFLQHHLLRQKIFSPEDILSASVTMGSSGTSPTL